MQGGVFGAVANSAAVLAVLRQASASFHRGVANTAGFRAIA
jgi:hypothetical protein